MSDFWKIEDTGTLKDGEKVFRSAEKYTTNDINDQPVEIATNPKEFTASELQAEIDAVDRRISSYQSVKNQLLVLQVEMANIR